MYVSSVLSAAHELDERGHLLLEVVPDRGQVSLVEDPALPFREGRVKAEAEVRVASGGAHRLRGVRRPHEEAGATDDAVLVGVDGDRRIRFARAKREAREPW